MSTCDLDAGSIKNSTRDVAGVALFKLLRNVLNSIATPTRKDDFWKNIKVGGWVLGIIFNLKNYTAVCVLVYLW